MVLSYCYIQFCIDCFMLSEIRTFILYICEFRYVVFCVGPAKRAESLYRIVSEQKLAI